MTPSVIGYKKADKHFWEITWMVRKNIKQWYIYIYGCISHNHSQSEMAIYNSFFFLFNTITSFLQQDFPHIIQRKELAYSRSTMNVIVSAKRWKNMYGTNHQQSASHQHQSAHNSLLSNGIEPESWHASQFIILYMSVSGTCWAKVVVNQPTDKTTMHCLIRMTTDTSHTGLFQSDFPKF